MLPHYIVSAIRIAYPELSGVYTTDFYNRPLVRIKKKKGRKLARVPSPKKVSKKEVPVHQAAYQAKGEERKDNPCDSKAGDQDRPACGGNPTLNPTIRSAYHHPAVLRIRLN